MLHYDPGGFLCVFSKNLYKLHVEAENLSTLYTQVFTTKTVS